MTLENERLEQIQAQLNAIEVELGATVVATNPEFRDVIRTTRAKISSARDILGWTLRFVDPDGEDHRNRIKAEVPKIVRS
tara:strand:+ start:1460 stop:1699 length:240 start_codon:yes stop_codon:yes gene_type:complete